MTRLLWKEWQERRSWLLLWMVAIVVCGRLCAGTIAIRVPDEYFRLDGAGESAGAGRRVERIRQRVNRGACGVSLYACMLLEAAAAGESADRAAGGAGCAAAGRAAHSPARSRAVPALHDARASAARRRHVLAAAGRLLPAGVGVFHRAARVGREHTHRTHAGCGRAARCHDHHRAHPALLGYPHAVLPGNQRVVDARAARAFRRDAVAGTTLSPLRRSS